MSNETVKLLSEVPLFSTLKEKDLRSILKVAKRKDYQEGQPILREGEEKKVGFYLILDGGVEVKQGDKTLSKLGPGQFFGEMSALDGKGRSADVFALEDTQCLLLTTWGFKSVVKSHPEIALEIIAELSRRLRKTNAALTE